MKGYSPYTGKDRWTAIAAILLAVALIAGCFGILYVWTRHLDTKAPESASSDEVIWHTDPPVPTKVDTGAQYTLTIEDAMRRIDRHNADVREQWGIVDEPESEAEAVERPAIEEHTEAELTAPEPVPRVLVPEARAGPEAEVDAEDPFEREVLVLAKMLSGECVEGQAADKIMASWTVINRVESPDWPDSVIAVVEDPDQFFAYFRSTVPTEESLQVAREVLADWYAGDYSSREETCGDAIYLFFSASGDGLVNAFREEY